MNSHIHNRKQVIDSLEAELAGPGSGGAIVDLRSQVNFDDYSERFLDHRTPDGQEILASRPTSRYSIGILHPVGSIQEEDVDENEDQKEISKDRQAGPDVTRFTGAPDTDDYDSFTSSDSRQPSTHALSFLGSDSATKLVITLIGGRYSEVHVHCGGEAATWWERTPVEIRYELNLSELQRVVRLTPISSSGSGDTLNIEALVIRRRHTSGVLFTVALTNRTSDPQGDASCLFQAKSEIELQDGITSCILPYPDSEIDTSTSIEDQEMALMYRSRQTYAVGHGCAADWSKEVPPMKLRSEYFPSFEMPSMEADAFDGGRRIQVDMYRLAGLHPDDDGMVELDLLARQYETWIQRQRVEANGLPQKYGPAATSVLERASLALNRIKAGIELVRTEPLVRQAFQMANHAILLQQIARQRRQISITTANTLKFTTPKPSFNPSDPGPNKGKWRAFQIGFVLANLVGTVDRNNLGDVDLDTWESEREAVELIWFPTGGGKTEAYLGLAAFSMFLRRLRDSEDVGVDVLMRYTLRLLTVQQFERAARLVLAMNVVKTKSDLPGSPFKIGIWVGSSSTPNQHERKSEYNQGSIQALRRLRREKDAPNPFLLRQCPWCGAQMGVIGPMRRGRARGGNISYLVQGYRQVENKVIFHCPDSDCEFHAHLPVFVVDSDVYDERPDLVIGTVDKFARLSWLPQARTIFGKAYGQLDEASPPTLIIQDELHLISGPLGSLAGLFEALIEEMATDTRNGEAVKPKIVASTATIKRYNQQVLDLYARTRVNLFPPPGLSESDSFFSSYALVEGTSELASGRKYVGIYAPGLPSMQTLQVRVFATVLAASAQFDDADQKDPWHTLLVFYNSLRELGGALSLFQSDIPERMKHVSSRNQIPRRYLKRIMELTGRISNDEVPKALELLGQAVTEQKNRAFDACLASNIIEVGIDIDRLSLLGVVGQPKTTSQYIQVTGRVGRQWWSRPGLILTLYSSSKPRDHSHFEKFRSYHERLYAQVEPTSVTPYSRPCLERALHALMVAHVRQNSDPRVGPLPFPEDAITEFVDVVERRVAMVDSNELDTLKRVFARRIKEWKSWQHIDWERSHDSPGLIYSAGSYLPDDERMISWSVPQSMRSVDAECSLQISLPQP